MRHPIRRLAAVAVAGVLAAAGVAVATGRLSYAVTHGVSMHPVYAAGALVLVARSPSYHTGQIVAYENAHGVVVLHRIVGGDSSGYVFKGDNNQSVDPDRPTSAQLVGRAVVHMPRVGGIVQSPFTWGLLVLGVLFGAFLMTPAHRRRAARPTRERAAVRSKLLVPLLAIDTILVGALGLSFVVSAGTVTPPKPSGPTQTGTFRYHAGIAPSDTYPLGALDTGDAVYLRLLKAVDVTFAYTTDAPPDSVTGTGRLDVELSSADGWHATLPLVAPAPLVAGRLDLTGTLDVAPIQTMAAGVAKAAGINTSTLDLSVAASVAVSVDGAVPGDYSTRLPFKLSPLALALSGVKPTPSPGGPALVSTTPLGNAPATAAPAAKAGSSRNLRIALAIGLLLALGATAMVWPTSEDPADDTANPVLRHARAVHIRLPASVTRVELADRSALEDLARGFDCPLVEGDDGWEGVLSGDVVYWARTRIPPAPVDSAAVSRPALLASAGQGSPLAGLGLAGETAAAAL